MNRLTETSAGVAEQLQSTRQMAEDLIDAQSVALQAQQEILNNGEELKVTLKDSTQGKYYAAQNTVSMTHLHQITQITLCLCNMSLKACVVSSRSSVLPPKSSRWRSPSSLTECPFCTVFC